MPKLNQIIAVCKGKKSHAQKVLTEVHHKVQKPELLTGISRTYRPKDEDGDKLPPESKRVQYTVKEAVADASAVLNELFDIVATQDQANTTASADVVVNGTAVLKDVPVTHLLFLEKQLVDLHTFVEKLPVLDPAYDWSFSDEADCFATPAQETTRTKKIPKSFVAYEATKEHPAQVQVFNEDVIAGYWSTVAFSGAIPASEKNAMLARVRQLQEAVKLAREQANGQEAPDFRTGKAVLSFIFGDGTA